MMKSYSGQDSFIFLTVIKIPAEGSVVISWQLRLPRF